MGEKIGISILADITNEIILNKSFFDAISLIIAIDKTIPTQEPPVCINLKNKKE